MSHNTAFSWLNFLNTSQTPPLPDYSIPYPSTSKYCPGNIPPLLNHTPKLSTLVHPSRYTSYINGYPFRDIAPASCCFFLTCLPYIEILQITMHVPWITACPQADIIACFCTLDTVSSLDLMPHQPAGWGNICWKASDSDSAPNRAAGKIVAQESTPLSSYQPPTELCFSPNIWHLVCVVTCGTC